MSDNTFITIPVANEPTRSSSKQRTVRRGGLVKTNNMQTISTNATYYDAIIAATEEGKSDTDAILHAQGVVQAIEEDIKLREITSLKVKDDGIDKSSTGGTNDINDYESGDSDIEYDQDGNPYNNVGQKARSAFLKLKSAMIKISAFSNLKKSKEKPDILEFFNIKELHKKLNVTVSQYDTILERVLEDSEYQMENLFYKKLLEAEDKFKAKLRLQYDSLRSHTRCETQIDALRKENSILKQEVKQMILMNSQISGELKDLRIYKSNAQVEERLMSEKLANRKAHIKVLTGKVKKLQDSLASKSADNQEDQTCHESCISENDQNEDAKSVEEEENVPNDITDWFINAQVEKPKWNISRKTNLLNKNIFSIMHNIEYNEDDVCNDTTGLPDEDEICQKIDKKYKNQILGLKFQLENERKEGKKESIINTKRNQKMRKIIQVLKECLTVLQNEQNDTELTVNNSDTKSISSMSSRLKEVEAIYERKELLKNLISGLNGNSMEYDYYSSTDKEDSQIYRGSRPSSCGIPSTRDIPIMAAPIVPIQLKSEKITKVKKKSCNEFNSVKGWVIAAKKRNIPPPPGIMTVSLIESNIQMESDRSIAEESLRISRRPGVESIMRRQRPVSARTNISQNSVRFAPTLEECSSNATLKRSRQAITPIN